MPRPAIAAVAAAAVALGVAAEAAAYEWSELSRWLPDLLAGWTLIGLGLATLASGRPRGTGALLLLAGFSWFALNFESTGPPAVRWVAVHAAYLHRAPLLQLALAPPAGRPRTRLAAAGVALAWSAAVVWPLWDEDGSALVLSVAFVGIAATARARASGRRERLVAGHGLAAVAILAAAIAADALRSLMGASGSVTEATVDGYAAAVAITGAVVFLAARLESPTSLAERAVALEQSGTTLRDALRDLLGDDRLELHLEPTPSRDARPEPGQVVTPVVLAGMRVASVTHDPSTLEDAATRAAVLAAVGLAAERARLREEVERQIDAVEASQRRLLVAEEDERRRLAARLDRGAGRDLDDLRRLVGDAERALEGEPDLAAALARAEDHVSRMRPELDALVHGLGGVVPGSFAWSLERLAAAVPVNARLDLDEDPVPADVASALWFVCAESLANVVKHAEARSVGVRLTVDDQAVQLTVEDDGRGGADPQGSGLAGLADRMAALRGELDVVSPPGRGTRVVASVPLDDG